MDLIIGGFIHLLCMTLGIGLNLRWHRKNKDEDWQSIDIIRFFMYITSLYYLYATLGSLFSNDSMMLSTYEWYILCIFHGFTSGPLYSYGRSILAETSMLGYEGLYVGLMTSASLVLSLLIPITIEMLTTKGPGTGISPMRMNELVGKISTRDIPADQVITNEDIEWQT